MRAEQVTRKLIVVPDADQSTAGAAVWWCLNGEVRAEAFRSQLSAFLPEDRLPGDPSPEMALRRALMAQRERQRMVRPLKGGKLSLVQEREENGRLHYTELLRVALNELGQPLFELEVSTDFPVERAELLRDEIRSQFWSHTGLLSSSDVSSWLIQQAYKLGAVSLRENGGMYFVPRWGCDEWRMIVRAVREVSAHAMCEMPVLRSDEAVSAILLSVSEEVKSEVKAFDEVLSEGEAGAKALKSKEARCERVLEKVSQYEALLGSSLDDLKGSLKAVKIRLSAAMIAASMAE